MVRAVYRPHVLGIDDGPFEKTPGARVPIVGVMMEGSDLVESVAITDFPVDGPDVTAFLAEWVRALRVADALQGVVLGGITIAGLGIVDVLALAETLTIPVVVVNRRDPGNHRLADALGYAGLEARMEIVDRTPTAVAASSSYCRRARATASAWPTASTRVPRSAALRSAPVPCLGCAASAASRAIAWPI